MVGSERYSDRVYNQQQVKIMAAANTELNAFEIAIKAYLDKRAKEDALFAKTYKKKGKTIQKCCLFLISEAQKRAFKSDKGQIAALPDDEVYGLAVHYYDEDNLDIDNMPEEKVASAKEMVDKSIRVATPKTGGFGMELNLFG